MNVVTNSPSDVRELYRDDFQRLEGYLPGADVPWLHALRSQALEQFMESGFPTMKQEEWKYTDVRPIAMRRFSSASRLGHIDPMMLRSLSVARHVLVFVDGYYAPALSALDALPQGVRVISVAQALREDAEEIEPWFGRYTTNARAGFHALSIALMQDGAFVHISRDVAVDGPVQLLFIATGTPDMGAYCRNIIVAEAGSRATVVESYIGTGTGMYLTDVVTEVVVEAGAVLEHYRIEREAAAAYHIGGTHVHQERDSRYSSHSITLGGRIVRHELDCALAAAGAQCALNGLYVGRRRQHLDHHTRIDHRVPRCTSREWYKGVLDDAARGVFSGRVVVHPLAQHSDAAQANHNLLLSENAEADSRPQFEIYADDVKCAHGSSTGALSADALFYMRTRGLDAAIARQLLVYAFASDVLARMSLAPLRTLLEEHLAGQLLRTNAILEPAP